METMRGLTRKLSTSAGVGADIIIPKFPSKSIAGWLLKQSKSKFTIMMQSRYVVLRYEKENQVYYLEYCKNESLVKASNNDNKIFFDTVEWTRPYDTSEDCKRFEILANKRVYLFEASSNSEMKVWLASFALVLDEQKQSRQVNIPFLVQTFEKDGENGLLRLITEEMNTDVYPPDIAKSLGQHVKYLKVTSKYLQEDIEMKILKTKRYDILKISVKTVINIVSQRLEPVLSSDSSMYLSASLGDLHALICQITKFQNQINLLYYGPGNVQPPTFDLAQRLPDICDRYVNGSKELDKTSLKPFEGAVHHLVQNCTNIVNAFLAKPSVTLQKRDDETFYTTLPIDIWEILNHHLDLGNESDCAILQVMIASKVGTALSRVCAIMSDFVVNLESFETDLKQIELELLSAIANDAALHIEEVCVLIQGFENEDIRNTINEIYDSVILEIVGLGGLCLRRLGDIILTDLRPHLLEVFTEDWLEGNQLKIAIATLKDYFGDLERYLVPFWLEKFVLQSLESIILNYAWNVIFRDWVIGNTQSGIESGPSSPSRSRSASASANAEYEEGRVSGSGGLFAQWGARVKQMMTKQVMGNTPASPLAQAAAYTAGILTAKAAMKVTLKAEPESLGRLAQDVNTLNAFFSQKAGQEKAQDILAILGEISLLLQLPLPQIAEHIKIRLNEFPSSAQALNETAMASISLRVDLPDTALAEYTEAIGTKLLTTATAARKSKDDNTFEGNLGYLYNELLALAIHHNDQQRVTVQASSVTSPKELSRMEKVKRLMNVPLAALKAVVAENEVEDIEEEDDADPGISSSVPFQSVGSKNPPKGDIISPLIPFAPKRSRGTGRRQSTNTNQMKLRRFSSLLVPDQNSQAPLVRQVLGIMNSQLAQNIRIQSEAQRLLEARELEQRRIRQTMLFFESWLDKKSSLIWKKRWFKLLSKPKIAPDPDECPFTYTFAWAKKPGGAIIKAVEVTSLESMNLLEVQRPLVFNRDTQMVLLASQITTTNTEGVLSVKTKEASSTMTNIDMISSYYILVLVIEQKTGGAEGREIVLRCTNVDKLIRWINTLSQAASLAYDAARKEWTRQAKIDLEQEVALKIKQSVVPAQSSRQRISMLAAFGAAHTPESSQSQEKKPEPTPLETLRVMDALRESVSEAPPSPVKEPETTPITANFDKDDEDGNESDIQSTTTSRSSFGSAWAKDYEGGRSDDDEDVDLVPDSGRLDSTDSVLINTTDFSSESVAINDTKQRTSLLSSFSRFSVRTVGLGLKRLSSQRISFEDTMRDSRAVDPNEIDEISHSKTQSTLQAEEGRKEETMTVKTSAAESAIIQTSKQENKIAEEKELETTAITGQTSRVSQSNSNRPSGQSFSIIPSRSASTNKQTPEMLQGWLMKRALSLTGMGYQWKKRYCKIDITSCSLVTSETEDCTDLKQCKIIDIRKAIIIEASEHNRRNKRDMGALCGFSLMTGSKLQVFNTKTVEEGERWVSLLNAWKEHFKFRARIER